MYKSHNQMFVQVHFNRYLARRIPCQQKKGLSDFCPLMALKSLSNDKFDNFFGASLNLAKPGYTELRSLWLSMTIFY